MREALKYLAGSITSISCTAPVLPRPAMIPHACAHEGSDIGEVAIMGDGVALRKLTAIAHRTGTTLLFIKKRRWLWNTARWRAFLRL